MVSLSVLTQKGATTVLLFVFPTEPKLSFTRRATLRPKPKQVVVVLTNFDTANKHAVGSMRLEVLITQRQEK